MRKQAELEFKQERPLSLESYINENQQSWKKWLDGVTEPNSHFDEFYIFFSYNFFSLFEHNDDMWLFLDLEFVLISRVKNVVCVN